MTDETYTGEDAEHEIEEKRRVERKKNLKNKVEKQKKRVEKAEARIEELEEELEEMRKAKRTEDESLDVLRNVDVDEVEDVDSVELPRDDDDAAAVGSSYRCAKIWLGEQRRRD